MISPDSPELTTLLKLSTDWALVGRQICRRSWLVWLYTIPNDEIPILRHMRDKGLISLVRGRGPDKEAILFARIPPDLEAEAEQLIRQAEEAVTAPRKRIPKDLAA